jgi:hypothetical protein
MSCCSLEGSATISVQAGGLAYWYPGAPAPDLNVTAVELGSRPGVLLERISRVALTGGAIAFGDTVVANLVVAVSTGFIDEQASAMPSTLDKPEQRAQECNAHGDHDQQPWHEHFERNAQPFPEELSVHIQPLQCDRP